MRWMAHWRAVLKQRSTFGAYLDPVADKLLLSTLFLVLLHKGLMPVTVTVLVFGRDVGILLVSALLYAAVGRREFHPSIWGKANTLAQIAAVAAVLLQQVTPDWYWVEAFRTVALDATMALTVISGCTMRGWFRAAAGPRRPTALPSESLRTKRIAPCPILSRSLRMGVRPLASIRSHPVSGEALRIVLEILRASGVFNLHIAKLFGIEDFATLQALDKLGVFVPGNDPDLRMSAGGCHRSRGFVPSSNSSWMRPFRLRRARRSGPSREGQLSPQQ